MYKKWFLAVLAAVVFGSCARVDVQTGGDSSIDVASLESYGWLEVKPERGDKVRAQNPNVEGWVKASVDKALQQKGYKVSTAAEPDFFITWLGAVEEKVKQESIDHFYRSYGYGPVLKMKAKKQQEAKDIYEYEEGTLILDLLDPASHRTFWHGTATGRLLKDMTEEQGQLYIDKLVRQILKDFPQSK